MATIAATHTVVKSKPADRPFGAGLTRFSPEFDRRDYTAADEAWYVENVSAASPEFPGSEGWMDSAEMEERARQAEWERRFEDAMAAEPRCAACGLLADALTASLCDRCAMALDADLDIDAGGTCAACGRSVDYLEPSGFCCPCDLAACDMSASGNRGC